jgi:hypothetical protein
MVKTSLHLAAPQQPNQRFGIEDGVLSGRPYLVEGHVTVDGDFNDTPPLGELCHSALDVTGCHDRRAPVEDASIRGDLAGKPAKGVSLGLDLEAPQVTPDEGKVRPLMRLGDPELVDCGRRLLLTGKKVLAEGCPH